jgi:hypothetical protein
MNDIQTLLNLINSLKDVGINTYEFIIMITFIIFKYSFYGLVVYLLYLYSRSGKNK